MLGMYFMPSIIFAKIKKDTIYLERLFSYHDTHSMPNYVEDSLGNIYLKYSFNTIKRNPTLFLIPTMYTIAKGKRMYVGETYGKVYFSDYGNYNIKRQVVTGSLASYRKTMPIILDYIIPNIYGISLYEEHMISPFHRTNRKYYKYFFKNLTPDFIYLSFRPKIKNTQLINGYAVINKHSGRIHNVYFKGEYDLIKFEINSDMGDSIRKNADLPLRCDTQADFKFMGNKICARFTVGLECPISLPDSISNVTDLNLMERIRPYPLSAFEKSAYDKDYEEKLHTDSIRNTSKHENKIRDFAWNIIGDHMLNSISAQSSNASIRFSPLFNPLYLSYSHSRGLAYKVKIGAKLQVNKNQDISFTPHVGYNFKIKEFFYSTPLRYTYNRKKNNWIEFTWKNGNRITNSSVLDIIKDENRDTIDFTALNLDYFNDEIYQIKNNISLGKHIDFTMGCVFHKRIAVNRYNMEMLGKPSKYQSFAPQICIGIHPYENGPLFTANYERSLKGIIDSNIGYERWEFDVSYKKTLTRLRTFNFRLGAGFYTNKTSEYFVDYSNFKENYLPDGWDDEWTGNFQLINSQWYNTSTYYVRANTSYESPLMCLTWLPFLGKYIETERLYLGILDIDHVRPYIELGYGLTNRYFSIGVFGSIANGHFYEFGSKFTFELFRKW